MRVYVLTPLDIHERAISNPWVTNDTEKIEQIEKEIRDELGDYGLFEIDIAECEVE